MKLSTWRSIRDIYHYQGARLWWSSPNPLMDGKRPCDDEGRALDLIDMLASGAFV